MKRILIFGGAGMLGHQLSQDLRHQFDTWVTVRTSYKDYEAAGIFEPTRVLGGIDVADTASVTAALERVQPDVVINAVGVVKQRAQANDPIPTISVNSLFPHRLASLCRVSGRRVIHVSTDCVFSGRKGMYNEDDEPDPLDLYGRSKLLGEITGPGCLTLRTSIIGRELHTRYGLVEWFLSKDGGSVDGYQRAIYTGLTTHALGCVIGQLITDFESVCGLWHLSSDPISKFELLCMLREAFGLDVAIRPNTDVQIDRSMDSTRLRRLTGYQPPTWSQMIRDLAQETGPYEEKRRTNVCRR